MSALIALFIVMAWIVGILSALAIGLAVAVAAFNFIIDIFDGL